MIRTIRMFAGAAALGLAAAACGDRPADDPYTDPATAPAPAPEPAPMTPGVYDPAAPGAQPMDTLGMYHDTLGTGTTGTTGTPQP
jgi:hypothetical protein